MVRSDIRPYEKFVKTGPQNEFKLRLTLGISNLIWLNTKNSVKLIYCLFQEFNLRGL
jgi:hypothetical protein